MNVVIIVLTDGREMLARKDVENNLYEKVRVFNVYQGENGQVQTGLVPFCALAPDAKLPLNDTYIMSEFPCPSDIEAKYIQSTTNIALA